MWKRQTSKLGFGDAGIWDDGVRDIKQIFEVIYHEEDYLNIRFRDIKILYDKTQWEITAKMKGKSWSLMIRRLGNLAIRVMNVSPT